MSYEKQYKFSRELFFYPAETDFSHAGYPKHTPPLLFEAPVQHTSNVLHLHSRAVIIQQNRLSERMYRSDGMTAFLIVERPRDRHLRFSDGPLR